MKSACQQNDLPLLILVFAVYCASLSSLYCRPPEQDCSFSLPRQHSMYISYLKFYLGDLSLYPIYLFNPSFIFVFRDSWIFLSYSRIELNNYHILLLLKLFGLSHQEHFSLSISIPLTYFHQYRYFVADSITVISWLAWFVVIIKEAFGFVCLFVLFLNFLALQNSPGLSSMFFTSILESLISPCSSYFFPQQMILNLQMLGMLYNSLK